MNNSSQIESIFKCNRSNHEYRMAPFLCIKPECEQNPICCNICKEQFHRQHLISEFVNIDEIQTMSSLNMKKILNLFEQFKSQINQIQRLIDAINYQQQYIKQPSGTLVRQISMFFKQKVKKQITSCAKNISVTLTQLENYITNFIINQDQQQQQNQKEYVHINLQKAIRKSVIKKKHLKLHKKLNNFYLWVDMKNLYSLQIKPLLQIQNLNKLSIQKHNP